jgi:hypothetical protein
MACLGCARQQSLPVACRFATMTRYGPGSTGLGGVSLKY